MAAVDNAAASTALSSTPPSRGSSSSVPSTPVRGAARTLEEYGDTVQMYDSPRHSHESSTSLLHGQHSRSSSAASFDSFVGQEQRSFVQIPPGLPRLDEEDNIAIYDEEGEHDDEFPGHNGRRGSLQKKIEDDTARLENGGSPGSASRRQRKRNTHHRKRSSVIPPVVVESASKAAMYVKENRGLLMIAASQAAFAAMNAMVGPRFYL